MRHASKLVLLPLAALVACGGMDPEPGKSASGALTTPTAVQLRLRGQDAAGLASFKLAAASLTVRGDGAPLPVAVNHGAVELTNTGQAWLLGTLTVPPGVSALEVTLQLANPGSVTDAGGSKTLDTEGPPIRFTAPVALFALQNKATVHLDLLRSLSPQSATSRWMVPQITVHF